MKKAQEVYVCVCVRVPGRRQNYAGPRSSRVQDPASRVKAVRAKRSMTISDGLCGLCVYIHIAGVAFVLFTPC